MRNIVILISGAGSNMQAIVKTAQRERWGIKYGADVACVISNKATAGGIAWAKAQGIATHTLDHKAYASREDFDAAMMQCIAPYDAPQEPALVVLAGFMRILSAGFVQRFSGRLLNIHPSLLPAFPGLNTHQRALDAGCKVAGATVHLVTPELDHGKILAQAVVPVLPQDTPQTLSDRVLAQEHRMYPQAVADWLRANSA